jgi:hypothetical protein
LFENRVLRIIFVPKRDEVTGGWRKLHNEELHNLYSLLNMQKDVMGGVCSTQSDENLQTILTEKPERKRSLGRPRRG